MADCGSATPRISLTFVSNTALSQVINILILICELFNQAAHIAKIMSE
jgi:hypothetical protein